MSTVQTIIDRACRLLGQLNSGESADAQESADSLIALNAMLGSWRNQELMCYAVQDESISLSSGNTNRTIGPSGNLVTTRPVRIEDAYIIYQNISTPIIILNEEEWASISDKTVTSTYPNRIYYKPEMPDGRIYLYPIPNVSSTLHVLTWTPVLDFASVATSISLPPGWEDALATNLALYMAPEFEREPSQMLISMARSSKAMIKQVNTRTIRAYTELPILVNRYKPNILTNQ